MKLLFEMDKKDYDPNGEAYIRPSVRAIIIQNGKIAMVYSQKYNYYKFPGGGMKQGENQEETLIRETKEEVGLIIIPSSICEYGYVHRIQKGEHEPIFIQDNYYYLCEVELDVVSQTLDDYEIEEGFILKFVDPRVAIATNRDGEHGEQDFIMIEREALVLERLIQDGYL